MMASTKTGKRPLRSLSAHEKLEAIRRVHDGESKASVARDIGVPESTLRGWCKNEGKITYLSRQSSPETDESAAIEPKEKRPKIEDAAMVQPFNLSLKQSTSFTPNSSESLYTPVDYSKNDIMDATPKTPQNLSIKTEIPKSTASQSNERERNRAELARLSIELGLNRPEMFTASPPSSSSATLADLAANINALSHWNGLLVQQQLLTGGQTNNKKVTQPDTSSNHVTSSSSKQLSPSLMKLPKDKEKEIMDDYIQSWLRKQEVAITSQIRAQEVALTSQIRAQEAALTTQMRPSNNHSNNHRLSPPTTSTTQLSLPPVTDPTITTASGSTTNNSNSNGVNNQFSPSWFWSWYKQFMPPSQCSLAATGTAEKPILYKQLTKETSSSSHSNGIDNLLSTVLNHPHINQASQERLSASSASTTNGTNNSGRNVVNNNNNNCHQNNNNNTNKVKSVLDNLFTNNNNNNVSVNKAEESKEGDDNNLSQSEALEHGQKFMKWLESCSDPSVTAVQIMQFRSLLNNLKNGADRRNGDLRQNKTKVKRK